MRVSDDEKIMFTKNIGVMLGSGIPLGEAVKLEAEQARNSFFKRILIRIAGDLQSGASFSAALALHVGVFGNFYISIVRAGEVSGSLEKNMSYLFEYLSSQRAFKRALIGALMYPLFILGAIAVLTVLLGIFALPTIGDLLRSFDAEPTFFTSIILSFADHTEEYGMGGLLILIIGSAFFLFLKQTKTGLMALDSITLGIPVFGALARNAELIRFSRVLATLLKSGIPVHESLAFSRMSLHNSVFQKAVGDMIPFVLQGQPISAFLDRKLFPPMYVQMIEVGEKSARIEQNLEYLANVYQKETEATLKNMLTLLEPALLVIIGAVVLFLALAILGPIYQVIGGNNQ